MKYVKEIIPELRSILNEMQIDILMTAVKSGHKIPIQSVLEDDGMAPWTCSECGLDPYISTIPKQYLYKTPFTSPDLIPSPITDGYPSCSYIKMQRALE